MWQKKKILKKYEAKGEIGEIQSMRKILLTVAGFEVRERGPWAKECRQSLEVENTPGQDQKDIGSFMLQKHGIEFS